MEEEEEEEEGRGRERWRNGRRMGRNLERKSRVEVGLGILIIGEGGHMARSKGVGLESYVEYPLGRMSEGVSKKQGA